MKISIGWLADFVDLSGIPHQDIADRLTLRTAEVEGVETIRRDLRSIVAAAVLHCAPIGTDGALALVKVDIGGATRMTVCAAPNVRAGMTAAFALPGAILAGGEVVKVRERSGHPSEGVLCAAAEIGLGSAHEGLLELPSGITAGTPLASLIPADDTLIEIDNKSLTHRPDLWGHYGFARELGAIFGRPLAEYATANLADWDALPPFPIAIGDADGCPLYSAVALEVSANTAAPMRIQGRLLTLGITPVKMLVDVTNYVQLELGQPTHAFDAGDIRTIRVDRAADAREFPTLDGKLRRLLPEDLLIYGDDEPIALAGIMGGLHSRIRAETRTIILESANFRASRIRRTSVRLNLRTDASMRFEKKLPPIFTRIAAGRIVRELKMAGITATARSRYSHIGDFCDAARSITIAPGWMASRAGASIDDTTAVDLLKGIGFASLRRDDGAIVVSVPPFRSAADISIPEDISEEVMRLFGYENITPVPPEGPLVPVKPHLGTLNQHRTRRILSMGHGFTEVQTYGWLADDWISRIGYAPAQPLVVRNPIAAGRGRMRDTLVPNLLAVASQNCRLRDAFRIYEIGKVFRMTKDGKHHEENHLAGVVALQSSTDPAQTVRTVRGAIEDIARAASLPTPEFARISPLDGHPWMVTSHVLEVSAKGIPLGHLGLLPRSLVPAVLTGGHAAWFSLRMPALEGEPFPSQKYVPPPAFPCSWQDFTCDWPIARGFADLVAVLDKYAHPHVESRSLVAFYQPKQGTTARYSFRYVLRWPDRTPTPADVQEFHSGFLRFAAANSITLA